MHEKHESTKKSALARYFHRRVQLDPRTTTKSYRNLMIHLLKNESGFMEKGKSDGQHTGRFIPNSVPNSMTKQFTYLNIVYA